MSDPKTTGGGNVHGWGPMVDDLAQRRTTALGMGGEQFVERQKSLGKLTVRHRLELLVDPGTWVEYGMLADHMDSGLGDRYLAADGAVTGIGEIDGRPVAIAAYDFSVMAGSMGAVGENKIRRMRHHAISQRIPMVWLLDSAGGAVRNASAARITGATGPLYDTPASSTLDATDSSGAFGTVGFLDLPAGTASLTIVVPQGAKVRGDTFALPVRGGAVTVAALQLIAP